MQLKNDIYEVLTPSGFSDFFGIQTNDVDVLFHILFSDNTTIDCTQGHLLKFPNGDFLEACFISVGDVLYGGLTVIDVQYTEGSFEVFDLLEVELDNEYFTNEVVSHNCAFIDNIETIFTAAQQTLATGGGCIALSTPNGMGNWFHKTYTAAQKRENSFLPIFLPWTVHPERDQTWRDQQTKDLGVRNAAQECDGDFASSGNTFIDPVILQWYEQNQIAEPIERRLGDKSYWIWEYPDPMKYYMLVADVARGDGADYSAFHVIDIETVTQVAEYKSQIGTRDFAKVLINSAREYNNALLVIEHASIGWDVIQSVLEMQYENVYYSQRGEYSMNVETYMDRYDRNNSLVPGFATTSITRPLILEKMRAFLENKHAKVRSLRTLEELRVFIWKNNKPQAMQGYNDDLVMPFAIGMFLRETSLKFRKTMQDLSYSSINGFTKTGGNEFEVYSPNYSNNQNPWSIEIQTGNGTQQENLNWLI